MPSAKTKGVPLRRSILLVAIAGIVPVAIAAAVAEWAFFSQAERAAEAKTEEVTRIAASAIDVELRQSIAALQGVSLSPLLDSPSDLPRFRIMLRRLIDGAHGWSTVTLATPDRQVLVSTASEAGPLPLIFEQESFDAVIRTSKPAVGGLARRPSGIWGIAVRVPVIRDGKLRYVLSAVQSPATFRDIVQQQGLPEEWVLSVFDAEGLRVARSRDHEAHLGGAAAPSLAQLMSSKKDAGSGITYTLEGVKGYTSFVRLRDYGWSIAINIPTAIVSAAAIKPAALWVVGLGLALVLAVLAAKAAARRIEEPIVALGKAATMVGEGDIPPAPRTQITEIAALGEALVNAAGTLKKIGAERVAIGAERDALLDSERAARSEAMRMGRLKDQFLATLSHELRTPLNSILGWAEILRHARATEADSRQGLEVIERNARAQAKLVEELLDVNRIASGKIQLDLQHLEPATIIRTAVDVARPAAAAKGIALEAQLDMSAGRIYADPARVQQIMGNLLANAIKFTPRGGEVRVRLSREASVVRIVVTDTGEGIAADFIQNIFDRFRQADASTTRKHGGLGLGLSIVRDLVTLHGGHVRAESAGPGLGATFTIELPLAAADHEVAHARLPDFAISDLRGISVLVVDDDSDARTLVARLLEESGAKVAAVESADAALEALPHLGPDVLVSDISMPQVDGYEFLRRVRALDEAHLRRIPAIALTAFAREEDRDRVLAAGFDVHIAKPIVPARLTSEIARLARQRNFRAA